VTVRERDDRWVELAARLYGIPELDLRDIVTHGDDSLSLSILIQVTRKAFLSDLYFWGVLGEFTQIDIRNTLSGLQHDFCTLWNEMVQEAKKGRYSTPVCILREIRGHYLALHQGSDAAPTVFSPSTDPFDNILYEPLSYPLCDIASHRPDSIARVPVPTQSAHLPDASSHHSTSSGSSVSRQVNKSSIIVGLSSPSHTMTPTEIGDGSQASTATSPALPVHTSPHPTDASPPAAVATALQDIPEAATLSHSLEGTMQRDIVVPRVEPDILSIGSMPTPSTPPVLNESLKSCDADAASTSNPLLLASSISIPASPPPSSVPPLPNAEFLALLSSTTPSLSTRNATVPHLRARGLVNTGSMCFANAVLQLLVHSPPLWDLFRELGDLKGPHRAGAPETSDCAIPLVDATLSFFEEFVFKEPPPP
jgi:hypothetical protein